jgi:FtsH-binding integral membrane protein
MAVDLADEPQCEVKLVLVEPARAAHAAHCGEQPRADRPRRAEGGEQAVHGRQPLNLHGTTGEPVFLECDGLSPDIIEGGAGFSPSKERLKMANGFDPRATASPQPATIGVGRDSVAFDAGLRSHMLKVYNYMASGILLTGIVALLFSRGGLESPAAQVFINGGILAWVIMLSPLALVMIMSFGINRISTPAAQAMFWVYAVLMGLSLSTICLVYTTGSIAETFFATAAAFAGLSLWGYTTKKDLSAFGTFLIMGLVGLIVASLINVFLKSDGMQLVISALGVLIFAGLTAYDTQKIKSMYFAVAGTDFAGKAVVMGALTLYLDFINLFLFLLRFMGSRD